MTDTPRTDAALVPFIAVTKGELIGELVRADDMRELERENAALRKEIELFRNALNAINAAMEKATLQAKPNAGL